MIASFADATTEDIYDGRNSKAARKISASIWNVARRKLDQLEAAHELRDLTVPPSNNLEKLAGDLAGFYSIRINDQFRLVFKFTEGRASEVRIVDYH